MARNISSTAAGSPEPPSTTWLKATRFVSRLSPRKKVPALTGWSSSRALSNPAIIVGITQTAAVRPEPIATAHRTDPPGGTDDREPDPKPGRLHRESKKRRP